LLAETGTQGALAVADFQTLAMAMLRKQFALIHG